MIGSMDEGLFSKIFQTELTRNVPLPNLIILKTCSVEPNEPRYLICDE
jgi:hypothetical protein